ncbi:hypothetical protein C8F04DRAFT_1288987 [Mycena alexandri]|uniref:Uncharacterized protein n=1 Tax=Mycena alexandri TaxID=1745969 RepID=A0AAD6SLP6_9AGAR|nr:hypothetical protein C8F04DRAFT_1288987 [Mycena alexandri]
MEMPAPKRKRNEPDAPGLTTRTKNRLAEPGKVDAKASRRTAVEMEKARADAEAQQQAETSKRIDAIARVAEMEDAQRAEDKIYDETANHPVDPPSPVPARRPSTPEDNKMAVDTENFDDDESDGFVPNDGEEEEEEEEEEPEEEEGEGEEEEEEERVVKRRGPVKSRRTDVASARGTQDSAGTPIVPQKRKVDNDSHSSAPKPKAGRKKLKVVKKGGLAKQSRASSASGHSSLVGGEEDESMVHSGGPALDDDEHEGVERPVPAGKKRGLPKAVSPHFPFETFAYPHFSSSLSIVKIAPVPSKPLTKKEQRGNAKKWNLSHLPPGTSDRFTNVVVPLARELCGTLQPWAPLTLLQMQGVVNRAFKQDILLPNGKRSPVIYVVEPSNAWYGLINYRLNDWRAGFAAQSAKATTDLIRHRIDEEEIEIEDAREKAEAIAAGASESDFPPAAVRGFSFRSVAGISAFVHWARQIHAKSQTMAFHWSTWGDGVEKQGFFLSHLIVCTYASHLNFLDSIPDEYARSSDPPYGAALMAAQAVDRNLLYWQTGVYTVPKGQAGQFSFDNWGDLKVRTPTGGNKLTRRATKFLGSLKAWDQKHWDEFREAAEEWQDKKVRRATSSSQASSEAGDLTEEEEEELIVLSD